MTCYSAKYLGDKIKTYRQHEEYLLQKLVRKIERKYELTKLGRLAPIFMRGYYNSNGQIIDSKFDEWVHVGEIYEEPTFPDTIDFKDCPCVFFGLRYNPNNSNSYEHVTPDMVLDTFKEAAMIDDDLIVVENLRHRSNALYFKVIIPLSSYNYRDELTYENKKIPRQVQPYKKEYKLILDFLITNYYDMFNRIYMVFNHDDKEMEYYLRYKQNWSFDYRNQIHSKILAELFVYARDHDLIEFLNEIMIVITKEL